MPRRKRGRDKPKSDSRRDRSKDLPVLNTVAAWRIGEPRPTFGRDHVMVEEPPRQWRPRAPFPVPELGETIGFYEINGRIYLGRPDDPRAGVRACRGATGSTGPCPGSSRTWTSSSRSGGGKQPAAGEGSGRTNIATFA